MSSIEEILRRIKAAGTKGKTKLIAIDGRGGSGKSSLAAELVTRSPDLKILPIDAFPCTPEQHPWHPLGTQILVDWQRLRKEALLPLVEGKDACFTRTPWWKSQPVGPEECVLAHGTVLVEGCYALHPELRDIYDLRIWVECPQEEALNRATNRDGGEHVR